MQMRNARKQRKETRKLALDRLRNIRGNRKILKILRKQILNESYE